MSDWVEDAAKHIREIVLSICDRAPSAGGMALVIRSHAPVIDKCGCCEGVRSKLGQIIEFGPDAAWHIYLERAYLIACRGAGVEPPSIESLMKQMAAWPQYNVPDADKVAEKMWIAGRVPTRIPFAAGTIPGPDKLQFDSLMDLAAALRKELE
ncbi:MAG: hypothetical protein ABIH23_16855 [bacterium]